MQGAAQQPGSGRLYLPAAQLQEVWGYVQAALPEEACGLLIGCVEQDAAYVRVVRLAHNRSRERQDRYLIDPFDYRDAERFCLQEKEAGLRVLGFWHSHPNGPALPSRIDQEDAFELYQSFPERYCYLIFSPQAPEGRTMGAWRLNAQGTALDALVLRLDE